MIISHAKQFLFLEVPHTGSHSISAELLEYYGGEMILRKHANLSQFLNQASTEEKRYFKFATVRNPLDYMVTHFLKYKNNHKGQYTNPDHLLENGGHVTELHLKQFAFAQKEEVTFSDYLEKFFNSIYHNWFLIGSHKLDYVIRFENIQEDYAAALRLMGLEQHRPLPHINPTKGKQKRDYKEYYDERIIPKVVENFGPFLQKWGYQFPEEWNASSVPLANTIKFQIKENIAGRLSPYVLMDPDAPNIKQFKKFADKIL